jgi:ligand-binding sensor domain-containing protein
MPRNHILLFTLLFNCILYSCKAQRQTEKSYVDAIIKNNRLFALTSSGHINIFDTNTGTAIDTNIHTVSAITAIGTDRKGQIIVTEKNRNVDILDDNKLTFRKIFTSSALVYAIVFDQSNQLYLITGKGIVNIATRKIYLADSTFHLNHQLRGWSKPSSVSMDTDDNIWVGSGYGEWGGDLFVFSTTEKKFIKPVLNKFRIELFPVKSIFNDGKSVYISCGLQHMMTSGCIVKFDKLQCSSVFFSESHWYKEKEMTEGEYIGPALYNNVDSCIYFYSQNGIFKGSHKNDLSNISAWTKVASPKLHWTSGQPDAVGSPMNVLKMTFDGNGKLFLITQNDGIGVLEGQTFHLLY